MSWLILVTAALGGGIVTWALEVWVTSIRNFETARLLLVAELTMIASALQISSQIDQVLPLPTTAWETQRHIVARSIAKQDRRLWAGLNAVYSSIFISSRLGTVGTEELESVLADLRKFRLGPIRGVVAYGLAFLWRHDPSAEI